MKKFLLLLLFTVYAHAQDYKPQWEKITELEASGEFKKAAAETDAVYLLAKKSHNEPQLLKAFFFKAKYMQMLEENAQALIINSLLAEIKTATPATKALMQSLYAQMLADIFSRNSYEIRRRTNVAGPAPQDFKEWGENNFKDAINDAYKASIQNRDLLYNTPLSAYEAIIDFAPVVAKTNRSLYDFLVTRYIEYERNRQNYFYGTPNPLDTPYIFGDETAFQKVVIYDTVAGQTSRLKLLQELEAFYISKKDNLSLQRAVLRRLGYVDNEVYSPKKRELYLATVQQLAERWGDTPFAYRALYKEAELYMQLADKKLHPDYLQKALQICETLIASKEKHDVIFEAENLKAGIINRSVRLQTEAYVMPGQPSLASIGFKNMEAVTLSFYKIPNNTPPRAHLAHYNNNYKSAFTDSILKTTPALTKTYTLPQVLPHFEYSTEVILPPLAKGDYLVAISPVGNPNVTEYAFARLQASQIALTSQRVTNATRFFITDRASGAPVPDVAVSYKDQKLKTDKNGRVTIKHTTKKGENVPATFIYRGDTLNATYYNYNYTYSKDRKEPAKVNVAVYFDRAIYRPGQKVFFKGIATQFEDGKYSVVPNVYFSMDVTDDARNKVAHFRLKTNEFGSFTGEFELPKTGMTGTYEFEVEEDEDMESDPAYDEEEEEHPFWDNVDFDSSYASFEVEEYKRPTFEVAFKPVTKAYVVNDSITVTGTAKAFSGARLGNARVVYRVRRTRNYRYYNPRYNNDDDYYGPGRNEDGGLVGNDTIETDAQGNFTITFKAKPDENDAEGKGDYIYTVYADVMDINGETHSQQLAIKVSSRLLYTKLSIPQPKVDAAKGTQVSFSIENVNGQPQKAQGEITVYKKISRKRLVIGRPWRAPEIQTITEAEFVKHFPHLPYGNETDTLIEAKPYFTKTVNTATDKSLLLNDFKGWPSGTYKLVFSVKDSLGRKDESTVNFTLERKEDNFLPDNRLFSIQQVNENAIKDGYVTVEVRTGLPLLYGNLSGYVNDSLMYDKAVVIKNGRAAFKIPVVKNAQTGMGITFDFVWQNQMFTETAEAVITVPPTPLTLEMESISNRLVPGGEQTVSFTIKNGKNQEAELLAGMYDTALDQFATKDWNGPDTYNYPTEFANRTEMLTDGITFGNFNNFEAYKGRNIRWGDSFYMYGFDIIKTSNAYINYLPKGQVIASGDVTVSGIVSDEDGLPLPGVAVIINGTSEGTVTDLDGKYTIFVGKDELILFSYFGYYDVKTPAPANGVLNPTLKATDSKLEEVVVIGYGTKTKKAVISSAQHYYTTVSSDTIEGKSNLGISFIQSLQGQIPGLNVSTGSGSPGRGDTIMIRGAGTISGSVSPLYVIDGVPMAADAFREINAEDIMNVTVLKDAGATSIYGNRGANGVIIITTKKTMEDLKQVQTRKNFNETAFFFPQLKTDKKGNVTFSFTTPEALTEWKLRVLAHNKKAVFGNFENKYFTQKDLMVVPNLPRFLRESDTLTISAKITNMTPEAKNGNAMLQLFDAVTLQPVDVLMGNINSTKPFTLPASGNTTVSFTIAVPTGLQGVQYKIVAKAGNYADGEENILPVLTNSMLVTESIPIWVRENSTKTYTFDNLKNNTSTTLRHQGITLEYTGNPAWIAFKSLPYLMEYEHECAEQVFSRYYANSIAAHIINSNPKIAEVFAAWRKTGLTSKLDQNEELKSIILAETPWVLEAQSEAEQKNRLALLFDLDKMKSSIDANFKKLEEKQLPSGAFPWFSGGAENEYITRHIVSGFGHLKQLGLITKADSLRVAAITQKAVPYLDNAFTYKDKTLKKSRKKNDPFRIAYPHNDLHYLYARSFYLKQYPPGDSLAKAIRPYITDIKQHWTGYTLYQKGMAALILHRYGETATAKKVLTHLKESSSNNADWGMYWIDNKPGRWWYQAPVETHALLIEAFAEVNNDTASVDAMKVWLIKQKQNSHWATTKANTEAVYALLMQGTSWLSLQGSSTFKLGDDTLLAKKMAESDKEAGTGYIKLQWQPEEITKDMATLTVTNNSAVPGFGGFYWQYFENLDKIKPAQEGLMNIKKELYLKNSADQDIELVPITEKTPLKVGDLVTVRLVLTLKEDAEYVHLKDMRASAFEPVDVLSGYKRKDGLHYYQSTRDAATHFFFDNIQRGTYVLEYDVRVNNAGEFSNGITTLQSMYAPEFSGHTAGVRVRTE